MQEDKMPKRKAHNSRRLNELSNEKIMEMAREKLRGLSLSQAARGGLGGDKVLLKELGRRGLRETLIAEGVLVRKHRSGWLANMGEEELYNHISSSYSGKTVTELKSHSYQTYAYASQSHVLERLVEDGIIIRSCRESGSVSRMEQLSDSEIIDAIRKEHEGDTITEFEERNSRLCSIVRAKEGLMEKLVQSGVLVRKRMKNGAYSGLKDEQLKALVEREYEGLSLMDLRKENGSLYNLINQRKLQNELVEEGILSRNNRSYNYWKDWQNVRKELDEVIELVGHFPSSGELTRMKKGSLRYAIHTYHGGIETVKTKMGHSSESEEGKIEDLLEEYAGVKDDK
jgi:hypothetical protein